MPRPKKNADPKHPGWLEGFGLRMVSALSKEETRNWRERWRRTFAVTTKQDTGRWVNGGYDWHTFSFEHAKSVAGPEAKAEYLAQPCERFVLIPDGHGSRTESGFVVEGPHPDLGGRDMLVVPEDLQWTMAFTHEDGWLGPYFCLRDWVR